MRFSASHNAGKRLRAAYTVVECDVSLYCQADTEAFDMTPLLAINLLGPKEIIVYVVVIVVIVAAAVYVRSTSSR